MPARKRWRGTTKERGYCGDHPAERQQRLARYRPGDICAHGGEALMYPLPRRRNGKLVSPWLDLPHTSDRSGYLPGLSCRNHNRSEGATRGNRLRGRQRAIQTPWRASRNW